jgi:hypothetical protein
MLLKGLPPTFTRALANSVFEASPNQSALSEADQAKFREVVFDTAAQAYGHLDRARSLPLSLFPPPFLPPSSPLSVGLSPLMSVRRSFQEKLSRSTRASCIHTMLPAVFAAEYLEDLRRCDFNPLSPALRTPRSQFWTQFSLLKSVWTRAI